MDKKKLCAVVTGGARGIGAAIVKRLVEDSFGSVILLDLDLAAAEESALQIDPSGATVHPYACNVSDAAQVSDVFRKIAEEWGTVSVLVNNAGITRDAMFHKMTQAQRDVPYLPCCDRCHARAKIWKNCQPCLRFRLRQYRPEQLRRSKGSGYRFYQMPCQGKRKE